MSTGKTTGEPDGPGHSGYISKTSSGDEVKAATKGLFHRFLLNALKSCCCCTCSYLEKQKNAFLMLIRFLGGTLSFFCICIMMSKFAISEADEAYFPDTASRLAYTMDWNIFLVVPLFWDLLGVVKHADHLSLARTAAWSLMTLINSLQMATRVDVAELNDLAAVIVTVAFFRMLTVFANPANAKWKCVLEGPLGAVNFLLLLVYFMPSLLQCSLGQQESTSWFPW